MYYKALIVAIFLLNTFMLAAPIRGEDLLIREITSLLQALRLDDLDASGTVYPSLEDETQEAGIEDTDSALDSSQGTDDDGDTIAAQGLQNDYSYEREGKRRKLN
ncbi:hypothetical protein FRB94_011085 [Tulasnella sp. JGI-2019a]|nr:hypothetical protein FRB93_009785 [Tulasnella sp. JGI-2019a]KAG8993053.1 hypothetical protein FRB94_011085 [Tulasnella sp. JGI-2019a]KAG9024975.1 hypothetical protein FRB95_010838 [Tulasnella sp. JGI-2019a]